ncbi:vWA domain-containing protein [Peribacillus sp. SCS-37]|uniref:vWA domain-containing protein n=1 Tax=Paraperibacillus esterisolvens TaxID=3115296 RepID=UPI003905990E
MNVTKLPAGANAPVAKTGKVELRVEWNQSPCDLDIANFMVGNNGKVPSDDYMIFYNQPEDPERSVSFSNTGANAVRFSIDLDRISPSIEKCVFTATLDGAGTFSGVEGCRLIVKTDGNEIVYEVTGASKERALVVAELYKHSSGYKIRGIGRGFNGGLKPLAEAHGVAVEDEAPAPSPQPAPAPVKVNLTKIDLLKEKVVVSLEKKNLRTEKARVVAVLDASGSMAGLYRKGTVQRAFERALAVAACFDDDGEMDVFFFADKTFNAPSVTERDFENYIERTYPGPGITKKPRIGYGNNEPDVMAKVIRKYTKEMPRYDIPTYVLFFSDGGIYKDKEIGKLLKEASSKNIFWQFIGIGKAKFGILQKLDDLPGREVDNADFFSFRDLDKVTDEELYDRLFNEFPGWLREVRRKGILAQ